MSGPWFLVIADYDALTTEVITFTDTPLALAAYSEHERAHQDEPHVEVVLISAASEAIVRKGYPHMFHPPGLPRTSEGWVQYLRDYVPT